MDSSNGKYNFTFKLTVTGYGVKSGHTVNFNASTDVTVAYENGEFIITNGTIRQTGYVGDASASSWAQATVSDVQKII